jgi:NADH-quinone oxidoreductase subunit G
MKVTIDGHELDVAEGTTILKAAEKVGISIPTFCYHPGLSAPANCRMCLVNTNKAPKLLPACYATVMEGMVVTTTDEKTLRTRKSTLEFILLHHPVDCPICDQAGECVLQDNYFAHSAQPSRLFTKKDHKPKAEVIGPNVILDAERCIVCTRCVRFCEEVTKTRELQVVHRGEHAFVTTFPGRALDNDYAINTVDICPVGALTSRDFRFKMRVWFMKSADSVCSGCSRGCNIHLDHALSADRSHGEVQRYRPRENPEVNTYWMCDAGRLSYKAFQDGRVFEAAVDGRAQPLREALGAVARKVSTIRREGRLAVVPSLLATNEDLLALAALSNKLEVSTWYLGGRADGKEDAILQKADKNPNRRGLRDIANAFGISTVPLGSLTADLRSGSATGVLWLGHEHAPDAALTAALAAVPRVVLASNASEWTQGATVVLPTRTFEEVDGTWTNFEGRLQALSAGPAARPGPLPTWDVLIRLARQLGFLDLMPLTSAAEVRKTFGAVVPELAAPAPAQAA